MMKYVVITFLGIVGLLSFVACATDDEEYKTSTHRSAGCCSTHGGTYHGADTCSNPAGNGRSHHGACGRAEGNCSPSNLGTHHGSNGRIEFGARPMSTPMAAATPAPTAAPAYRNHRFPSLPEK